MGFFATPGRWRTWSAARTTFLVIAVTSFLFTEFGRHVLRPWVRENGIEDFGLTDTIGNWGGILVQIFAGITVIHPDRVQSIRLATFYSVGFVAYEFLQPVLPRGTFDWYDVLGTTVGYTLALLILTLIWRAFPDRT